MIGAQVLVNQLATLLAADATTLAPAMDANEIALVTNSDFTPSPLTVIGDVTLAAGNGLDAIVGAAGAQLVGSDPATGQKIITIKEPAGGWHWALTMDLVSPLIIYGFCLTSTGGAAYLAGQLLPAPITVQFTGDTIDIGIAAMRLPNSPLS
jgi:hypothetical protein